MDSTHVNQDFLIILISGTDVNASDQIIMTTKVIPLVGFLSLIRVTSSTDDVFVNFK